MIDDEGFKDSYYAAEVLAVGNGACTVRYETLHRDDEETLLVENILMERVRPYPSDLEYKEHLRRDIVDGWYHDGGWKGEIKKSFYFHMVLLAVNFCGGESSMTSHSNLPYGVADHEKGRIIP
ncbi:hypothetical protein L1887_35673 [Cichorium endivia]|nr:hypothetical protein L1887_35673 [Cichorium endivia]